MEPTQVSELRAAELDDRTGSCGVPGCGDSACPVPYGLCHCGCGAQTTIARQTRSERGAVKGFPALFVAHHTGRATLRERRRDEAVALYETHTYDEIAAITGSNRKTVARDLAARGVQPRIPAPRRKYDAPTERQCAREGCTNLFTPHRALDVANGFGLYCTPDCYHLASRRHPPPTERPCPTCKKPFTPKFPSWDQRSKFCTRRCRARYTWRSGRIFGGARDEIVERCFGSAARRKWKLIWAPNPGRPRNDARPDYAEAILRIRKARIQDPETSERDLVRKTGESRRMVRTALGKPI
jgi:hypothetical protein